MRRWLLNLTAWDSVGCLFWPFVGAGGYVAWFFACVEISRRLVPGVGNLMGLEVIVFALVGFVGGGLVPLTAAIARRLLVSGSRDRRPEAAVVAAVGGAFNGYCLALIAMVPVLAMLHTLDPRVPYLDAEEWNRYVTWRDTGAWAGGALGAAFAGWVVLAYSNEHENVPEDRE